MTTNMSIKTMLHEASCAPSEEVDVPAIEPQVCWTVLEMKENFNELLISCHQLDGNVVLMAMLQKQEVALQGCI